MLSRLFRRRTVWWPTWPVWVGLLLVVVTPALLWIFRGEDFLDGSHREVADVLVVEGWIGAVGIDAALAEFKSGNYRYVVTTSGLTGNRWDTQRWSYAAVAEQQLLRAGIPREQIILAAPENTEAQRTFASALAVRDALSSLDIPVTAINLFTRGVHARRSRLVFAKVLGSDIRVGVIAWQPSGHDAERWWQSTDRSEELLKETVGYLYELLLNSGRP